MVVKALFAVFLLTSIANGQRPPSTKGGDWKVKAWQAADPSWPVPSDFPELDDDNLKRRPSTGVAFTGGGSRSYLASAGYMAALEELGLVPNIRYITGISGGAWFTMCYTYSKEEVSDAILLGPIVSPENFTRSVLQEMDPQCMRRVTSGDFIPAMLKEMKKDHVGMGEAWVNRVRVPYRFQEWPSMHLHSRRTLPLHRFKLFTWSLLGSMPTHPSRGRKSSLTTFMPATLIL